MKAKDTIMTEGEIEMATGITSFPTGVAQAQWVLKTQAEISFKAGRQLGRKEVVEWLLSEGGFP